MIVKFSENAKIHNERPESIQDYNLWEFQAADDDFGEEGFFASRNSPLLQNIFPGTGGEN
jgi:hypothetical protein